MAFGCGRCCSIFILFCGVDLFEITLNRRVNKPTWKQITFQNNRKVFDVILKALSSVVNFVGSVYENDLSVNLIYSLWLMMMFETSKHVPKTEKRCCVFKNIYNTCAIKTLY